MEIVHRYSEDTNLLLLVRGEERYVLVWTDAHQSQVIEQIGRWAGDPQLSFSWLNAAELCTRIRTVHPDSGGR